MSDAASVTFEVLSVDRCRRGPIIAVARVALVIDGVEIVLDGFTLRDLRDHIEVTVPTYRHPVNGEWWPVVGMPTELQDAIGVAVCEAMGIEARVAQL